MSTLDDLMRAILERNRALARLAALREAALRGAYDQAEFEQALRTYRAAEAAVLLTGAARARPPSSAASAGPYPPDQAKTAVPDAFREALGAAERAEPVVHTARMRFVKWLVETGRVSDQC